jgi:hypothetical protein
MRQPTSRHMSHISRVTALIALIALIGIPAIAQSQRYTAADGKLRILLAQ